jgi:GTP-binding protein
MAITPVVAIVGRPNVGKSSLFNRLSGRRQAITHDTAGTTRDANYAGVEWNGQHFFLVDTAGLEKADGELNLKVQEQIAEVTGTADALLVVVDAGVMITDQDRTAARLALKTGKPVILAINKIDAATGGVADEFARLGAKTMIETSAIHGRGAGDLLDAITAAIPAAEAPEVEAVITLALLGRPNVGKSSILNSLVGKQQAIVSSAAGTTRDVANASLKYHGQTIQILDTAGLRRRGKIEAGVEKYDKTQAWLTRQLMADFAFVPWAPLIFTSATQGLHVTQLFELTNQIAERRGQQISTPELNKTIQGLVSKQPPAGMKGRLPKINYATQTGTNPPAFTIFTSHPELIHFSYTRYLENGLRSAYDFTGTPITITYRNKRSS